MAVFKLYPDCKLVKGSSRYAIYDLTRNNIFLISKELGDCFYGDTINLDSIPSSIRNSHSIKELIDNELGRMGTNNSFKPISEEFISPCIISDAVLEVRDEIPMLEKISSELSDLQCRSISLRFLNNESVSEILRCTDIFSDTFIASIEICLNYSNDIDSIITQLLEHISLCSRIVVMKSPQYKIEIKLNCIPIVYITRDGTCLYTEDCPRDYSKYASARLALYNESLKFNNCLNRKIAIDIRGDIKNCLFSDKNYGNIRNISIREVINFPQFRESWTITTDSLEKCRDCELRYACMNCIYFQKNCTYNVYK